MKYFFVYVSLPIVYSAFICYYVYGTTFSGYSSSGAFVYVVGAYAPTLTLGSGVFIANVFIWGALFGLVYGTIGIYCTSGGSGYVIYFN